MIGARPRTKAPGEPTKASLEFQSPHDRGTSSDMRCCARWADWASVLIPPSSGPVLVPPLLRLLCRLLFFFNPPMIGALPPPTGPRSLVIPPYLLFQSPHDRGTSSDYTLGVLVPLWILVSIPS